MSDARERRLAIFLHGLGDHGLSFRKLAAAFIDSEPDMRWITPTAAKRAVSVAGGQKMTAWFDLAELPVTEATPFDEAGFAASTKLVHSWIEEAIVSGIEPEDIFLCGFSQGAALALHAGIRFPAALGGIASFAGWMPGPPDVAPAQAAAHTRVLVVHGTRDSKVPARLSTAAQSALLPRARAICC
jgi:predicted esterase